MYKEQLGDVHQGARAYPVRMALGALMIKERLGTSDQETDLSGDDRTGE